MKYLILFLLLIPAISATDIDFRALVTNSNSTIPLIIDINSEQEFEAELEASIYDSDFNRGSTVTKKITVTPNSELIYLNLTIDPEELFYDVAVSLYSEDRDTEFIMHNTVIRYDPQHLKDNYTLPLTPKQILEEMNKSPEQEVEETPEKINYSTLLGILLIIISLAIVIFIIYYAIKE